MKNLKRTGKSTIVWILMGLMVIGLGGFGVTSFSGGSTEIGRVGETKITADDYLRVMRQQLQSLSQQAGQMITMTQASALGVPGAVLAQLVTAAALEDQARAIGISVGDEQVARTIAASPAFRSPAGQFDRTAYSEVLRRQGMTEAGFEADIRTDEARLLLQRAVISGISAPQQMIEQSAAWLLEERDLSWRELTSQDLPAQVSDPEQSVLEAWHQANADRFTAPEIRRLTYVWTTPEMLAPDVDLDEAALRETYQRNIAEYQQPERRMVSRLVMPSQAEAEQGIARITSGEATFESLVLGRGLTMDDAYMGEMRQEDLGDAGEAVFALDAPGVVGPIQTDLGPAIYQVNAILDPVDISFEEAAESLRQEAALDRAARQIEARMSEFEEMLAAGATLEDLAADTPLELGKIDWISNQPAPEASIAGYESFRELAETATVEDFPHIARLEDGGVFALRVDEIVPPTLRPFDEVRDEVLADWRRAETTRQLLALAEEARVHATPVELPATKSEAPVSEAHDATASILESGWVTETGLTRDGWIDGLPSDVLAAAFRIDEPGEMEVADGDGRVFLVRLDAIRAADMEQDMGQQVTEAIDARLSQSLQIDVFDYYNRAIQMRAGVQLNQAAIDALNTQIQ